MGFFALPHDREAAQTLRRCLDWHHRPTKIETFISHHFKLYKGPKRFNLRERANVWGVDIEFHWFSACTKCNYGKKKLFLYRTYQCWKYWQSAVAAMLITVISISASPHIYVQFLQILYAPMGTTATCVRDRTIFILFCGLETPPFKEHVLWMFFLKNIRLQNSF